MVPLQKIKQALQSEQKKWILCPILITTTKIIPNKDTVKTIVCDIV